VKGLAVFAIVVFAFSCDRKADKHDEHDHPSPPPSTGAKHDDEHHGDDHGHEELPHHISVSKEVMAAAGIKVAPVTKEVLAEALTLPGEIAADPDRLARISSPAAGRIESVSFREGAAVKKGEVLAVVRVPEIASIRASQRAAQARAKAARSNAERLRSLLAERLASEQAVLDAETEAESLEVEAKSLAEQLGALGAGAGASSISVRTPISGTVVNREAVVGQPATADQVLGTVADLDEVWFLARVFEKDLGKLRVGAAAEVHLNAYPAEHFAGSVEYVGQQIDSVARTVTARVRLKNRDGLLRLGLFGNCQIASGTPKKADPQLVVARSAVTDVAGKSVVFVQRGESEFELHEVTLGEEALGRVGVLAGLREGEQVVTDGVFTLKSMVLKGSIGEEHGH
jgi:membrane fusion protein, heavy metal efflux system